MRRPGPRRPTLPFAQPKLGKQVRELRTARNLSMEELAHRADLSQGTIWGVEELKRDPTLKTLRALARGLRVPLTLLAGLGLVGLLLSGCAMGKVVLMQNPATGQVFECHGDRTGPESYESDKCARALEAQGWRKLSERMVY